MKHNLLAIVFVACFAVFQATSAMAAGNGGGTDMTNVETGLKALENEDYTAARVAFTAAAGHGDPLGHYYLGAMYQRGLGGDRSEVKALEHYRKAAKKEVPEAEFAMGLFYQHGKAFLQKNPDVSVAWYEKAASQGSAAAKYNLAIMYATGEAVPLAYGSNPDYIKARGWFLITLDDMETSDDKSKVEALIEELEGHMTPGQIDRSKAFYDTWTAENK